MQENQGSKLTSDGARAYFNRMLILQAYKTNLKINVLHISKDVISPKICDAKLVKT